MHQAHPDLRIQPGPWLQESGRLYPGGVNIARRVNGEWVVDETAQTFFFMADAQHYIDSVEPD